MKNNYEAWLNRNSACGPSWKGKLLPLGAAGLATALVGLSVVMMAGLGLPAGQAPLEARGAASAPVQARAAAAAPAVRSARALPTVTVIGRRAPGGVAASPVAVPVPTVTAALPARPASGDVAARLSIAGDNLSQ
ncbi:hypothetical protein ACFPOE_20490 [Caenimonas terrae]|uniref:Uncharacterized protein n=1 Tax=Caenimonas terrae TaxID=696074 RepID=A0ABW0NK32_9BURK